jgi:cell wall-associated NlpC family hydrolase
LNTTKTDIAHIQNTYISGISGYVVVLGILCLLFVESCTQSVRFSSNKVVQPIKRADRSINSTNLTSQQIRIIEIAERSIGTPYCYGGTDKNVCLDCSGFIQNVFAEVGVLLPRTSKEQSKKGIEIPIREVRPGDLIFYDIDGSGSIDHVSLVIDDNSMIHASTSQGVVQQTIDDSYWIKRAKTARRLPL